MQGSCDISQRPAVGVFMECVVRAVSARPTCHDAGACMKQASPQKENTHVKPVGAEGQPTGSSEHHETFWSGDKPQRLTAGPWARLSVLMTKG